MPDLQIGVLSGYGIPRSLRRRVCHIYTRTRSGCDARLTGFGLGGVTFNNYDKVQNQAAEQHSTGNMVLMDGLSRDCWTPRT